MRGPGIALASLALLIVAVAYSVPAAEPSVDIYHATLGESGQRTAEISTAELRAILAEGGATVFDARPFMEFAPATFPVRGTFLLQKRWHARHSTTCRTFRARLRKHTPS